MYLFRLIYYSRSVIQDLGKPYTDEIKDILIRSKRNNPKLGVTGALVFNQTYFAQILEGDRKAVTEVFCKITRDERHGDIVILEATPVQQRLFLDWSMAFAGHSDVADGLYTRFSVTGEFSPSKMSADSLLGFMLALIGQEEKVASTAHKPFRAEQTRLHA